MHAYMYQHPLCRPQCRLYTRNALCCSESGFHVTDTSLQLQLVCSQPTVMPPTRCFEVREGPVGAQIQSTDFGFAYTAATYLVNWTATPPFFGRMRVFLNQYVLFALAVINPLAWVQHNWLLRSDPACNLALYLGPCLADGQTVQIAQQTREVTVNVVTSDNPVSSLLESAGDATLMNAYGWHDLNVPNACQSQSVQALPPTFFQNGWITYKCVSAGSVRPLVKHRFFPLQLWQASTVQGCECSRASQCQRQLGASSLVVSSACTHTRGLTCPRCFARWVTTGSQPPGQPRSRQEQCSGRAATGSRSLARCLPLPVRV